MIEKLFVYGTLHPGQAPWHLNDVVSLFVSLGPGSVRGHRYELPEFPAVILDPDGPEVEGEIFALPDESALLERLDSYEGYDPESPDGSRFLRVLTVATLPDFTELDCWIYTYNRPLP